MGPGRSLSLLLAICVGAALLTGCAGEQAADADRTDADEPGFGSPGKTASQIDRDTAAEEFPPDTPGGDDDSSESPPVTGADPLEPRIVRIRPLAPSAEQSDPGIARLQPHTIAPPPELAHERFEPATVRRPAPMPIIEPAKGQPEMPEAVAADPSEPATVSELAPMPIITPAKGQPERPEMFAAEPSSPFEPDMAPGPSAAETAGADPTTAEVAPGPSAVPLPPAAERPDAGDTSAETAYRVVKVFYGTDRARVAAPRAPVCFPFHWLGATLLAAGSAMILVAVAFRFRRTRIMRVLAVLAVVATGGLGLLVVYVTTQQAFTPPSSADRRPELAYGSARGQSLQLGTCEVSIPQRHQAGELESPSIVHFEVRENPRRHVVLLSVEETPADEFYAEMKQRVAKSRKKSALVFIHGFNVTFENAARRTAQMAHDLDFDGAPIFYSWPSQGSTVGYTIDENNVVWTVRHLKKFLSEIAERSGAEQVHLIAHSMGNRALAAALREFSFRPESSRPSFHQVVLTAPDIDADVFRRDIAPAIVRTAERVTLYASSNDAALLASKKVHGYPRAGDSGRGLLVIRGIDTIDVSRVNTSFFGHSYYGSSETVLADMFDLLSEGKPPENRKWLRPEYVGASRYWVFRR